MSLLPGEEIGLEKHENITQFIRLEKGLAKVYVTDKVYVADKPRSYVKEYILGGGFSITIPSNTEHNIVNIGSTELKLYTIYSPPEHPHNRLDKLKPSQ